MPYSHAKIDLAKIPDGPYKDNFIHFAEKHNALVDGTNDIKKDIDQLSGSTPEEKLEVHGAMKTVRGAIHYLHSKRVNTIIITAQLYLVLSILKWFGVSSEQVHRLFEVFVRFVESGGM